MSEPKHIVILGGGIGGISAARRLRRLLPKNHRITIIDREEKHLFQSSLLWMMTGERTESQISRPLSSLARKGIEVIHGEIQSLDPVQREVTVNREKIKSDYIIVAMGADLNENTIPGLQTTGHNLYSSQGVGNIYAELQKMESGRMVIVTVAPVYKCPAAPYEAALLVDDLCRNKGTRGSVEIEFYAAEPGPMGVAGPDVSNAVRGLLLDRGINYHSECQLQAVNEETKTLTFASGENVPFDLLVYVPLHQASPVASQAQLTNDAGWIAVDRQSLQTKFPGVFAVGDVTTIPLQMGKPLPKAGVFAHSQAEVVADNIAAHIKGSSVRKSFKGFGACFVETGDGKAGFGSGNFLAEPLPQVQLRKPSWLWHFGKVIFEKYWLWKHF